MFVKQIKITERKHDNYISGRHIEIQMADDMTTSTHVTSESFVYLILVGAKAERFKAADELTRQEAERLGVELEPAED